MCNLRNDTAKRDENAQDRLVANGSARSGPAKSDDRAGLDMSDDCARYWASLGNDEKLRDVDQGSEHAGLRLD